MTTCKDCYRRNPATGYCPVRTYEVEEDHEPCGSYATPPRDMNAPAEEATKVCKRCGRTLPLSSFSRNRNGLLGVCKDCMKAAQKKGAKPAKKKTPAKPAEPAEPEAPKEEPVAEFQEPEADLVGLLQLASDEELVGELRRRGTYVVDSWTDEQIRFHLKDFIRILRDRGYQIEASIIVTVTEKL